VTSASEHRETRRRLGTQVSEDVDERLRLMVCLRRQLLSRVVTDLLDKALPSMTDLIRMQQEKSRTDGT